MIITKIEEKNSFLITNNIFFDLIKKGNLYVFRKQFRKFYKNSYERDS